MQPIYEITFLIIKFYILFLIVLMTLLSMLVRSWKFMLFMPGERPLT